MRRMILSLAAGLLLAAPLSAQQTPAPAAAADVETVDAIIAALYDVISGPAGQKRDWTRFHSLFIPGARLIPTGRTTEGEVRHRVMTPEEYAAAQRRLALVDRDGPLGLGASGQRDPGALPAPPLMPLLHADHNRFRQTSDSSSSRIRTSYGSADASSSATS